MSDKHKATPVQLQRLLAQLKAEQHALLDAAAIEGGPLHRSHLHMIAELENVIAAVIALVDERGQRG
jgi:hypothetical protein